MLEIIDYVTKSIEVISDQDKDRLIETLVDAYKRGGKVFVTGAGRSGLVIKAFALRLMHLGFQVYVMGETIVPSMKKGDVLIALSGSGRTKSVVSVAEAAKSVGAVIVSITTYLDSPLARLGDVVVLIPGRTKLAREDDYYVRQVMGLHEPLTPLGTLFEDTVMIFLDGVIVELMEKLGVSEDDLKERHANVE
ncbi:3-hexulose-6-phosphate isomerase [Thermogladius calderae 1633]|uniref:3-hexulose-6-phosphate isomerase n=2 Tax=Thermogladius calderae TaxID=1200300 RepID=I3TE79_THEC1|nr:3-hexulose-6-phosphate isomerase [Thermogladius calderae 1633]